MSALSHRSHHAVLSALVAALVIVALPGTAAARPADTQGMPAAPVNAPGTDVAAPDQQVRRSVVNAPGTDVAAPDQQAPAIVLRRSGTRVPSRDQLDRNAVRPAAQADAIGPIDGTDDSGPAITLLALIALALGLAGVAFASRHAMSRRRGRAAV